MSIAHILSAAVSTDINGPARAPAGRMLPPGLIHMGLAQEIAPTLRDFGIDPESLFRLAGIDPSLFDDASSAIPFGALGRLLTLSVSRTNCPHFGLLVGKNASIQSLGIVGRLMLHSQTVGDALRALVSNLCVHNRGVIPSLSIEGDTVLFGYAFYLPNVQRADQISDGSVALAVNVLRSLCGARWNPIEVLLPRARPADQEPYRGHFRAAVRFNQETAAVVLSARDLDRPIPGADPVIKAVLEERLVQMNGDGGPAFADDIRRLLRTQLIGNRCSADDIADLLTMHRRTLSRRLKGIGYRTIANETRFEIARQLLETTEVPLGQIAAALGYSEASAFTRAFRRWAGQTPTAWRTVAGSNGRAMVSFDERQRTAACAPLDCGQRLFVTGAWNRDLAPASHHRAGEPHSISVAVPNCQTDGPTDQAQRGWKAPSSPIENPTVRNATWPGLASLEPKMVRRKAWSQ
ncbi:AraC family transcriptional regulator [Microbacteriaceae bacterium K1510]|nr:AraC family transcriptional regulator [Microbacteriaceae bacterium K1510]